MKTLITGIVIAYLCWYTLGYAKIVWKKGNKFAGLFITLLALSLIVVPLWKKFK